MTNDNYSPLVTIVIPVYNGKNFMSEAIDSALAQTYDNIEIIVINDGSNDGGETERIALSYGDKIRYISKENGGVSSALNVALKNANGDWFSWLSHDDLYFPNKIEKQINFLRELLKNYPSLDLERIALHSATVSIDINGKIIKKPNYKNTDIVEDSRKIIIDNIYNYKLSGCSFLVPMTAFKDYGGFKEDIRTVSDVEYWYRLIFNGFHFYCLKNDILVYNRSHGKQVGKTKVKLFNQELNDLYINIVDRFVDVFNPTILEIRRFYFGLVKRRIKQAAKYTKQKFIKGKISFFSYCFLLPLSTFFWTVRGFIFGFARAVFRKIFVKAK